MNLGNNHSRKNRADREKCRIEAFSSRTGIEIQIDAEPAQAFNFFADESFFCLLVACFSGVAWL
jgi:hypothetical protein